jgi:PKD repeat protein
MKKLILGLATCSLSLATIAQEPFKCTYAEVREQLMAQDPTFLQREAEYEEEIRQLILENAQVRGRDVVITIPIVFHVLHLGGSENISNEQIFDQVEILNRDFRRLNVAELATAIPHFADIAGDAMIQFALPTKDPLGNCTNGIDRIQTTETFRGSAESKMRPWPRSKYLNVWVTRIIGTPGVAGYATKPGTAEGLNQLLDGIMVGSQYVGSIGTSNPGVSRVLTHEVGHYFNLDHPWGATNEPVVGECGDDGVPDTPITKGYNNCTNRYGFQCSSTQINTTLDFSGVTVGGGTTDPTPVPQPLVMQASDTVGVGINITPFTAVGVSSGSTAAGEFAFSNWPDQAEGGETVAELTGTINTGKYYQFSFVPNVPYAMIPQQIRFSVRRSDDGPRTFSVRTGPGFGSDMAITNGGNSGIQIVSGSRANFVNDEGGNWFQNITVNLSGGSTGSQNPVTIRIYAWNAESPDGVFAIDNVNIGGTMGAIENVENYMEYAYCQKMFTQGQVDRMRAALNSGVGQRSSLWSESTLQATGIAEGYEAVCAPIADFYVVPGAPNFTNPAIPYPPLACTGTTVMFKDNSGGAPVTNWEWTFQDGEPATSNQQNPTVSFTSPGWKSVSLTVSNANGSHTKTSPFEVYVSNVDDAMTGLASYSFEENVGIWPFLHENYENNHTFWQRHTGAGHTGNACIRLNAGDIDMFDLMDPQNSGDIDDLITPNLNLTGIQDATFSFWYSYSTQTTDLANVTERLQIQRSNDCGKTWTWLSTESASTIQGSALITNGNSTTPGAWQFRTYTIPANLLTSNVRFRFRFISSAYSNHLFLDDINIGGPVGMADATGNTPMSVFPNPTNDQFFVRMAGMDVHSTEITLMDSRGAIVYRSIHAPQGDSGIMISSRELGLAEGLYVLRASNNMGTSTQKLMVGR